VKRHGKHHVLVVWLGDQHHAIRIMASTILRLLYFGQTACHLQDIGSHYLVREYISSALQLSKSQAVSQTLMHSKIQETQLHNSHLWRRQSLDQYRDCRTLSNHLIHLVHNEFVGGKVGSGFWLAKQNREENCYGFVNKLETFWRLGRVWRVLFICGYATEMFRCSVM
jgi:hypothetical protein